MALGAALPKCASPQQVFSIDHQAKYVDASQMYLSILTLQGLLLLSVK